MGIIQRRFTYRGKIKLSSNDMALARSGRKTCTVRLGILEVAGSEIDLTDGEDRIKVSIREVDNKRVYRELSDQDASEEGFNSVEELRLDLQQYYKRIDPEQPITVIRFLRV